MSTSSPVISVIMGIYNCAKTVPEAIDSILSQTYQDFELILCEDGSSDETLSVAKSYQARYPDKIVLLVNEKNMGLNYTLNRCLSVARGKYIARQDGDDRSLPNRFETELEFLEQNPQYALVSAFLEVYDDNGIWSHIINSEEPEPKDIIRGTAFSHSASLIRKSVFDKVGGYSEGKRLMRVEDKHLWYKIYAAGYKGRNIPQVLYSYRDDRDGYAKRKFKYRINGAYVGYLVAKHFRMSPKYYLLALRPIFVGLLPSCIYVRLHRRKLKKNRV